MDPRGATSNKPQERLAVLSRQMTAGNTGGAGSVWGLLPQAPPDPILAVGDAWRQDSDVRKLNLGVGAYRTEEGKPLVLNVVRKAEAALLHDPTLNKEYLPITGDPVFCKLARQLALGADCPAIQQGRVSTVQGLSGTGSLRVGAELLATHYKPSRVVLIPKPSWPTHRNIFTKAGMQVQEYRYFEPKSRGLDFQGLMADLGSAEPGAVVILHACAHNPTGVDPTPQQWRAILDIVQSRRLLPFFDSAYQGFASGDLNADAASLRMFANATAPDGSPQELMLAQSFAKNMGLYGERVGALSIISKSADVAKLVDGQLRLVIRPMYSNPPRHGAEIAAKVMGDPVLFREWCDELAGMANRIKAMRSSLTQALRRAGVPGDWSFIEKQIGMFTYTGLTRPQCERLTGKHHVYLTMDGRISMAGLNARGAEYLAGAIAEVVANS
mmetsp:Transcript_13911/g.37616  ORF Transcript_13911/g.37616 Transcript_13911/m.37616 type:complete len:441 (+) Transcript_13911:78-1400(+)|eukprot:CAMPEP_0202369824 /NCGR_PEP_ID=MMETSP1127-20130417/1581_1 /ASSEMBLY_ACC=CAM_ASM_000462 /TAXON_ID=3047 /ORGANISM="Dunaliella tertiolecta, Strain CCMP1320" /LENGTH=440 /DNA_ID=CAMNT_0048965597 /DNA_START=47 /DNA_END=1369 /DNA_ORIENTATION=+